MKWITGLLILGLLGGAVVQGLVRFWPADFARAHRMPSGPETGDGYWVRSTGVSLGLTVQETPAQVLERLDGVIRATPRTKVIAGSVDEGLVTYVTRTAFWGFPDVTTVGAEAGEGATELRLRANAWFAGYDWGVNLRRVQGWMGQAGFEMPPDVTTSP